MVYEHTKEDPKPKKDLLVAITAIVVILILTAWVAALKYYTN